MAVERASAEDASGAENNKAAQEPGGFGGLKDGKARAEDKMPEERSEPARKRPGRGGRKRGGRKKSPWQSTETFGSNRALGAESR